MLKGYYFITDAQLSLHGNARDVRDAVRAGVKVVQYRNKEADTRKMFEEAKALRQICKRTLFLINDRVDIALAVCADGVHLGNNDIPYGVARKLLGKKKIIGVTVHNLKEAREAARRGADYVGVSPIFSTKTKRDAGRPVGIQLIKEIKQHVKVPVIAIGGITLLNAQKVIESGADGICAISTVVTKPDCARQIKKFHALFRKT